MKSAIAGILLMTASVSPVFAQDQHVTWTLTVQPPAARPGGKVLVHMAGKIDEVRGQQRLLRDQLILLLAAEDHQRRARPVRVEQIPDAVRNAGRDMNHQNARLPGHAGGAHGRANGDVFVQTFNVLSLVFRVRSPIDDRDFVRTWDTKNSANT